MIEASSVWMGPREAFKIEKTLSAAVDDGCSRMTFLAADDQLGRVSLFPFHHSKMSTLGWVQKTTVYKFLKKFHLFCPYSAHCFSIPILPKILPAESARPYIAVQMAVVMLA